VGRGVGDGPFVGSGVAAGIGVHVGSGVTVGGSVPVGVMLGMAVGGPSVCVSRGCVGSGGGVHEGGSVGRKSATDSVAAGAAHPISRISRHRTISGKRFKEASLTGCRETCAHYRPLIEWGKTPMNPERVSTVSLQQKKKPAPAPTAKSAIGVG
jgi:hypothetical protein